MCILIKNLYNKYLQLSKIMLLKLRVDHAIIILLLLGSEQQHNQDLKEIYKV